MTAQVEQWPGLSRKSARAEIRMDLRSRWTEEEHEADYGEAVERARLRLAEAEERRAENGGSGAQPPNLDQETILRGAPVEPGAVQVRVGRDATLSDGRCGWRACYYPAAEEAVVSYVAPGQGAHFRVVTDPVTGERLRAYQLAQVDGLDTAQHLGVRAAGLEGERRDLEREYAHAVHVRDGELAAQKQRALDATPDCCAKCADRLNRAHLAENKRIALAVADRRASAQVRRFCRVWELDHLWTLTYRGEGERSYAALRRDVRAFFEAFREAFGRQPMVMVREPHPGGHGWHLHFAVHGWFSVRMIRALWPHGSVNVAGRRSGSSPRKVAGYIAKYVRKGLDPAHCAASGVEGRQPGQHRYWRTEGFAVEKEVARAQTPGRAVGWLRERTAGSPYRLWDSRTEKGWTGPPVLFFDYAVEEKDEKYARRHYGGPAGTGAGSASTVRNEKSGHAGRAARHVRSAHPHHRARG